MFALQETGALAATDLKYEQGIDFLLRTQFPDGSWWTPTRTWPLQPHFDSGFPHGRDQWISAAATAWAIIAALNELESVQGDLQNAQTILARHTTAESEAAKANGQKPAKSTVVFAREIRPILERSCGGCHNGEKPKGNYDLSSREGVLKGGQSGEPAIIPGDPNHSPLLRFVQDQVEDLEMPPLAKRQKFPALTQAEIRLIRNWIEQGAAE